MHRRLVAVGLGRFDTPHHARCPPSSLLFQQLVSWCRARWLVLQTNQPCHSVARVGWSCRPTNIASMQSVACNVVGCRWSADRCDQPILACWLVGPTIAVDQPSYVGHEGSVTSLVGRHTPLHHQPTQHHVYHTANTACSTTSPPAAPAHQARSPTPGYQFGTVGGALGHCGSAGGHRLCGNRRCGIYASVTPHQHHHRNTTPSATSTTASPYRHHMAERHQPN